MWTSYKPVTASTTSGNHKTKIRAPKAEPGTEWPTTLERLEVPKEAENEDRGTCGYIATLAWPGDQCNSKNSEIVPGKHNQTYQEVKIGFTGFAVVINDASTLNLTILSKTP